MIEHATNQRMLTQKAGPRAYVAIALGLAAAGCNRAPSAVPVPPDATGPAPTAPTPTMGANGDGLDKITLAEPDYLAPTARALLKKRMKRHAADAGALYRAVLTLNYDRAREFAQEIADEPRLARPIDDDATLLNAGLPRRFFELQDQLTTLARGIVSAAALRDHNALANAFGGLSTTCVECHSVYLKRPATAGGAGGTQP